MIEIDTGEAAGRPCTLCGESTSNGLSSGGKRSNCVSFFYDCRVEATLIFLRIGRNLLKCKCPCCLYFP